MQIINPPQAPFKLAASDRESQTWARLKRHIEERIETLRVENEADLDPSATAKTRGRIAELKSLLRLAKD